MGYSQQSKENKNDNKTKYYSVFMRFWSYDNSWVLLSRNEEKLVALLVYYSFRRVATTGFQNISVITSNSSWIRQAVLKWGVNTESLRIQHSTAARHSY